MRAAAGSSAKRRPSRERGRPPAVDGATAAEVREIAQRLRGEGLRMTRQRKAIIAAVCRASGRLTAQRILDEAKPECPDLGLATVYRTVEVLERCGYLRRVLEMDGGESLVVALAPHGHHVLCRRCSRVAEFSTCDLAGTIAAAVRETGFVVTGHNLELLGLCRQCATAEKEDR